MAKIKRKFTPEERLSILQEGHREGQAARYESIILRPPCIPDGN